MTFTPDKDRTGAQQEQRGGERGFTLLEMAIVLAIIGILIAMLAPVLGDIAENNRSELTEVRLRRIDDAMVVFLRQNGRLPCPARADAEPLGSEAADCNTGDVRGGIVPFRTLALPQDDARDGYGNYFTYRVAGGFADRALSAEIDSAEGLCGVGAQATRVGLDIVDMDGIVIADQDLAYVLVSHGRNGHGRFAPPGRDPINVEGAGMFEAENSDGDITFVDSVPLADGAPSGPYDDEMLWATRDGLASRAVEFGCSR